MFFRVCEKKIAYKCVQELFSSNQTEKLDVRALTREADIPDFGTQSMLPSILTELTQGVQRFRKY